MKYENIFKRYELKYILTDKQYFDFINYIKPFTTVDEYGISTVCSLYYDTSNYRLIRRSLEKPIYKEKLRLRSYGTPNDTGTVFIELKKKYDGVVYKRREAAQLSFAENYMNTKSSSDSQIFREIDYFKECYGDLKPAIFLSTQREAFYEKSNHSFRITFDREIKWRSCDLSPKYGSYGKILLPDGLTVMELKTPFALPLWITEYMTKNKINRTSFSKYGSAYTQMLAESA